MRNYKVLKDKFNKFGKIFEKTVDKTKKKCYCNSELIVFCSLMLFSLLGLAVAIVVSIPT